MTNLKPVLTDYSIEELNNVKDEIDEIILGKLSMPDNTPGAYDTLVNELNQKFIPEGKQVFLKQWRDLASKGKQSFRKNWLFALKYFTDKGFDNSLNLHNLIIHLVTQSDFFIDSVKLDSVLISLQDIDKLFKYCFPTLISDGAIELLKCKINS